MTVSELMARLGALVAADQSVADLPVVVHGYETGVDDVDVVGVRRADLHELADVADPDELWRGEHRLRRAGSRHGSRVLLVGSSRRRGLER